jgi:hypothetical protein
VSRRFATTTVHWEQLLVREILYIEYRFTARKTTSDKQKGEESDTPEIGGEVA